MEEKEKRCRELFARWYQNELTATELPEFWKLLAEADEQARLEPMMRQAFEQLQNDDLLSSARIMEMAASITGKEQVPLRKMTWKRLAVAASVLIAVALASILLWNRPAEKINSGIAATPNPEVSAPTVNKAAITLASGEVVYLDSAGIGKLAMEANITVVKLPNGQIAYQSIPGKKPQREIYNTLTNPKGSKPIDMILSDGSHVWLNAGSALTYPVLFIGVTRHVELKGEGYFQITRDVSKKFVVNANGMTTEVLGTQFNVNAYANEPRVKVTLVEGSVQVNNNGERLVKIKPGQQASGQIDGGGQIDVTTANVEKETAWKNGLFNLEGSSLKEAMRQLERWYDIQVVYEPGTKDIELTGKMTRGITLNGLMVVLKELGVNYRMDGRKLHILP